ncbi:high-affinity choline transporter 1-like [Amblyomma americanum]
MSAFLALSVTSVFALWTVASDVVFVLLFPQLLSLFYLRERTNAYGAIAGFLVGAVLRCLCGEPSMGIPVVIRLPLYDSDEGQRFPFRTACMLAGLFTLLLGSYVAQLCFDRGWLAPEKDICRCCCRTKRDEHGDSIPAHGSEIHTSRGEGATAFLSGERRRSSPAHVDYMSPSDTLSPCSVQSPSSTLSPGFLSLPSSIASPGSVTSPGKVMSPNAALSVAVADAESAVKRKARPSGAKKERKKTKGKKDRSPSKHTATGGSP